MSAIANPSAAASRLLVAAEPQLAIVDPTLPNDPDLRKLVEDVLAKLKYSMLMAATADAATTRSPLDRSLQAYFQGHAPAMRQRTRQTAAALLSAADSTRQRHFGRYAAIKPEDYRRLGSDQIASRVTKLALSEQHLLLAANKLSKTLRKLPPNFLVANPDLVAGLAYKKVELRIRSVSCIEETSEIGSDEISLGGTVTSPSGQSSKVAQFKVSDDFDEGEAVNYGGTGRLFCNWNLVTQASGFPYVYTAVMVMAEKDDGGFGKFLAELWEKIEDEVKSAISGAVGAAVGAAIGSAFGFIGTVVGTLLGLLIGWLISLFDNPDDIVGIKTVMLTLGAATKSYYDWAKLTAAQGLPMTLNFKGDGGFYKVRLGLHVKK